MRKIDPTTLDLSKLALSETGVPIGFRELLPEEYPSNGDVYDRTSKLGIVEEPRFRLQIRQPDGGSKQAYGDRITASWYKHYRILDVPDAIPANYGKVTGGTLKARDIVHRTSGQNILRVLKDDTEVSIASYEIHDVYRRQPAFPDLTNPSSTETFKKFQDYLPEPIKVDNIQWMSAPYECVINHVVGGKVVKHFVFDKDYKLAVDKMQVKIDAQTKQIRGLQNEISELTLAIGSLEEKRRHQSRAADRYAALAGERYNEIQSLRCQLDKASQEARDPAKAVVARTNEIEELKAQLRKLGEGQPTSKPVDFGAGYRELRSEEYPLSSDEFSYPTVSNPVRSWTRQNCDSGRSYGEVLKSYVDGFKYRRKIEQAYRPLDDHETPKIGDEFRYFENGEYSSWSPQNHGSGLTLAELKYISGCVANNAFEYRRKC